MDDHIQDRTKDGVLAEAKTDTNDGIVHHTQSSHTNELTPSKELEGAVAWCQVLGAFCLNLNTWGVMNAYGVYQTYYSLELLHSSSSSAISWIGSVQAFLMFVVSFFIGPIFDAGYLHTLLWTGSVLSVLGFFMTSLCTKYWQCFLAQGIAMGLGFGCLYLPAPALVSQHFHKNRALAIGISSTGSGIGGVIFPLVFSQLQPRIGFGWATRVLAFIFLFTSAIPLLTMRSPRTSSIGNIAEKKKENKEKVHFSVPQLFHELVDTSVLHDKPYLFLNCGLLAGYMGLYIVLYYINLYALERTTTTTSLASNILIILNSASTVGRIAPSALADRIGATHVLGVTTLISTLLVFCLLAVNDSAGLVVWAVVFGAAAGAFMALPAAGVVSVSAQRTRIGARLGMTLGMVGCGVLVAEPIAGAVLRGSGRWVGLVGWCGGLLALGALGLGAARVAKVGWIIRRSV